MTDRKEPFLRKLLATALFSLLASGLVSCAAAPRPAVMPRHLLHSPCAQARDLPGDPEVDPILFAGCDDAARTAFIRSNIGATVLIRVAAYDKAKGKIKYSGGTGTVIDADGTVVTAYHVIDDAEFIAVTPQELTANGQGVRRLNDIPMRVAAFSKENDAALLRPTYGTALPAPMVLCRHRRPAADDVLWHFGRTTTWAAGRITRTNVEANGVKVMEIDVRINFGDSGGPLVNAAGQLVGITLSLSDTNTMYFVPIDQALEAMKYGGGTDACPE